MKNLIVAALLAATPALAHEEDHGKAGATAEEHHKPSNHAKKGEHKDAPRSFATKPAVGTWAKCAVSGDIFRIGPETTMSEHDGRWYAFCCDECKPDFDKDPGKYSDKKNKS